MPAVSSGSDYCGSSLTAVLQDGFRVRYLGSMGFTGPRRIASAGMRAMQRPLLTLYSAARRRSENYRSDHPLSLTQFLDVSEYGLVVVDIEEEEEGDFVPVITKVITPVTNLLLWAAVRFHTRPTKKRSLGAAFVPVACSDGVLDKDSFVHLGSKQRFLAGLSHPPLFVCLLQRVDAPKSLECHAFVCASAEDSLAVCSVVAGAKDGGRTIGSLGYYCKASSTTYRSTTDVSQSELDGLSTITPSSSTLTEVSTRTPKKSRVKSPIHKRSESCPRQSDWRRSESPVLGSRYASPLDESDDDTRKTPRLSKRYIHNGYDNEGYNANLRARSIPTPELLSDEPQYGHVGLTNLEARKHVPAKEDADNSRPTSLPRYKFGQNEKSFQARGEKNVGISRSSSDSTITSKTKETVTVIQTVDFSSENESEQNSVLNGHGNGKQKRYKSVGCSTRSDIVPPHKPHKDMSTMTDSSVAWTTTEQSSDPEESDPVPKRYIKGPKSSELNHPRRKQMVSVELSKSLDFDSESEYSQIINRKKYDQVELQKVANKVWNNERALETGQPVTKGRTEHIDGDDSFTRTEYITPRRPPRHEPRFISKSVSYEDILGNGTNKVTINVPYHKPPSSESSYAPSKASYISQGIKGFNRRGQVKNWSTLSLASDRSYQASSTLPLTKNSRNKVIRWSSVEDVPRKRGVLSSIKNFSVKSLSRAKNKTEQLFNSLKRKMKDKQEPIYHRPYHQKRLGSESDSAYDTSEVCLSPDGTLQRQGKHQHRRESWSFHDLREEFHDNPDRPPRKNNHHNRVGSPGLSSEASDIPIRPSKKRSKGHRNKPRSSQDSSDSGLEESDYSGQLNKNRMAQNSKGLYSSEVSLISVNGHGHRSKDYHRYSKSNLQNELGYMP